MHEVERQAMQELIQRQDKEIKELRDQIKIRDRALAAFQRKPFDPKFIESQPPMERFY